MLRVIETFIRARGWLNYLLRASLVIWVIAPIVITIGNFMKEADAEQARLTLPFNERIQKEGELSREMQRRIERAKALGNAYTPELYFEDLKVLRLATGRYAIVCLPNPVYELQVCLGIIPSPNRNRCDEARFNSAREAFEKWAKPRGLDDLTSRDKLTGEDFLAGLVVFLLWLLTLYLKICAIAVPIYLLRMIGDGDDRVLVKAYRDRRAYLKAVILWPRYWLEYPDGGLYKRLLAEAEIRREGSLFRRLSKRERQRVRQLAVASDFIAARRSYRQRRPQPRFGLVAALLAALVLLPLSNLAQASKSDSGKARTAFTTTVGAVAHFVTTDVHPPWSVTDQAEVALVSEADLDFGETGKAPRVFYDPKRQIRPGPVYEIFHVPLPVQTLVV